MKFDSTQTRRLMLAGATPFPKPYPSVGKISIERITLTYSRSTTKRKTFIVIKEQLRDTLTRFVARRGVAAIFFPGKWVKTAKGRYVFKFSKQHDVHNFDYGEWFLRREINIDAIRGRLKKPKLALNKRGNPVRGVVFVYKDCPIMTTFEIVQTAGSIGTSGIRQPLDSDETNAHGGLSRDGCDYDGCDRGDVGNKSMNLDSCD